MLAIYNIIYIKKIRKFFMYKNPHIEPFCYVLKRALPSTGFDY